MSRIGLTLDAADAQVFDLLDAGGFRSAERRITEAEASAFAAVMGGCGQGEGGGATGCDSLLDRRLAQDISAIGVAFAMAPIDRRRAMRVTRLREVAFEQPARAGDVVSVGVAVDRLRPLSCDRVGVETSWQVTNNRGERIVRFRADIVCTTSARHSRELAELIPSCERRDPELECVNNIPV